jgi:hypothetical protein
VGDALGEFFSREGLRYKIALHINAALDRAGQILRELEGA